MRSLATMLPFASPMTGGCPRNRGAQALKRDYYLRKAKRERWEAFRTEQQANAAGGKGFSDYYRGWDLFEEDPDEGASILAHTFTTTRALLLKPPTPTNVLLLPPISTAAAATHTHRSRLMHRPVPLTTPPDLFSADNPAAVQDQAAFDAMAKDVEQRTAKRKAEVAAAGVEKERGNAAFKANQYGEALAAYSRAIEHHRGDKAVYANRALAHIKLRNFLSAVEVRAWAQGPAWLLCWAMAQVHRLGGVMGLFSIASAPAAAAAGISLGSHPAARATRGALHGEHRGGPFPLSRTPFSARQPPARTHTLTHTQVPREGLSAAVPPPPRYA